MKGRMKRGAFKSVTTLLLTLAMVLSAFAYLPIKNAKAADAYTLTFSVDTNATATHTIATGGTDGEFTIDGNIVALKNSGNVTIGSVAVDTVNNTATITVADGTPGKLNFGSDAFDLFAGGNKVTAETEFNSNTAILVQDPDNSGGGGGGAATSLDIRFNSEGNGSIKYSTDNQTTWIEVRNARNIPLEGITSLYVKAVPDDGYSTDEHTQVRIDGNVAFDATQLEAGVNLTDSLDKNIAIENVEFVSEGNNPAPGGGTEFGFDMTFVGSNIIVSIEGTTVNDESDQFDLDEYTFTGTVTAPGSNQPDEFNVLHFRPRYGDHPLKEVTINGVTYTANSPEVTVEGAEGLEEWYITVPGDVHYDINGVADMGSLVPTTIIWANPGATDIDAADALIEHGSARIIAVYDENGNKLDYHDYTNQQEQPDGSKSDAYGLNKGNGWAVVKAGYRVVFEFTPEYGYQLTKVAANEQELEPQSTTNQYVFTMPNTNVHFAATFTKTEDVVKANSKSVESGTIELGGALDGGTAQLTVNDVELSSDKIAGFESAAGDYTISNYLDIDLYNVFYKGKDDPDDVWSNKISELDDEATITIKLADGVTADDIVIVHNVHDGDEYEVIKIESYDAATNTITFKTKSFSNYAIATKAGAAKVTASNKAPKTGDNMMIFVMLLAISAVGLGIMTKSGLKKRFK